MHEVLLPPSTIPLAAAINGSSNSSEAVNVTLAQALQGRPVRLWNLRNTLWFMDSFTGCLVYRAVVHCRPQEMSLLMQLLELDLVTRTLIHDPDIVVTLLARKSPARKPCAYGFSLAA